MSDTLLSDPRKPRAVWFADGTGWRVGETCDELHVYPELGREGSMPWIAVKKGGVVIARVNCSQAAIVRYDVD